MQVFPLAVNGRNYSPNLGCAVQHRPILVNFRTRHHPQQWNLTRTLHMSPHDASQTRQFSSVKFLVTACPDGDCTCLLPDWDDTIFTVYR